MAESNPNARLEAFCDGVFAIAMTLLIIDVTLPSTPPISSTTDLWRAIGHLAPAISALVLSFGVIFITWVNHHAALKMVARSSASFIYANGLLLLTVVFVPFPTALLGRYVLTDHAAPAVVLYDSVLSAQAIAWILVCGTALRSGLSKDEHAARTIRQSYRNAYFACALYALLAIVALWFPFAMATLTVLSWMFWLVFSLRLKHS